MDRLKVIFASVLGITKEEVTSVLSPENTSSWDSLNAIVLITEIEKGFGVTFSYEEAMAVKNFADVITLVSSKGITLND